ncbi:hypothetical protein GCM10007170_45810 [Arthrobacter liuii]|uniref:Uncharacterized protein n=1 Tax=Arthrobacter liuii TaxID=1476996 RepID=A0ABQ2B232_9MICC|nr:hypothetical protein GCM10007170_45810 [Arthrobacter liuii]
MGGEGACARALITWRIPSPVLLRTTPVRLLALCLARREWKMQRLSAQAWVRIVLEFQLGWPKALDNRSRLMVKRTDQPTVSY